MTLQGTYNDLSSFECNLGMIITSDLQLIEPDFRSTLRKLKLYEVGWKDHQFEVCVNDF